MIPAAVGRVEFEMVSLAHAHRCSRLPMYSSKQFSKYATGHDWRSERRRQEPCPGRVLLAMFAVTVTSCSGHQRPRDQIARVLQLMHMVGPDASIYIVRVFE